MKQFHTKGRENSGKLCVLPSSPGGEGRSEGERFLQSHFRSRRLKLPGTGTRDPSQKSQSLVTSAAAESGDFNGLLTSPGRRESGQV